MSRKELGASGLRRLEPVRTVTHSLRSQTTHGKHAWAAVPDGLDLASEPLPAVINALILTGGDVLVILRRPCSKRSSSSAGKRG